jgi:hypothetical protein
MMEAARTSETSVNFYQTTRRYNPEDSHLRSHRRENLKSYKWYVNRQETKSQRRILTEEKVNAIGAWLSQSLRKSLERVAHESGVTKVSARTGKY